MKSIRWYVLGILGIVLISGVLLYKPVKFYLLKYSNRLLSENTIPVEKRVNETVEDFSWSLEKYGGEKLSFEEFKGKVVLINFWATWCPPCIVELPDLQELYTSYGDRVSFLFVAQDKEKNVTRFLEKKGYDLPVYFENGMTPKLFYNPSIPTTYIISKDGVVKMAKKGVYDWNNQEVRNLLDNLLAE